LINYLINYLANSSVILGSLTSCNESYKKRREHFYSCSGAICIPTYWLRVGPLYQF